MRSHVMLVPARAFSCSFVMSGLLGLALATAGCGRKASEADCQLIVDRNVELQMKAMNISDPAAISRKQGELRTILKDSLKDCVGRHVTDGMMNCVRGAASTEQIDDCLR